MITKRVGVKKFFDILSVYTIKLNKEEPKRTTSHKFEETTSHKFEEETYSTDFPTRILFRVVLMFKLR